MGPRAIIAGAGIGGLSTALALSQEGLAVTIYERAESLEEFGAGIQLTPNATRVLARLGVLDEVRAIATRPSAARAVRGADDVELFRIPLDDAEHRWGAPYLAIHRADLQQALAAAVRKRGDVDLRLGVAVAGFKAEGERVSVETMRGVEPSVDKADLLIGADGLRSRVRQGLDLGRSDKETFRGYVAFRATLPSSQLDPRWAKPDVVVRLGRRAHLVHYPLRGGSIINIVAVIESGWRPVASDHPWDGESDRPALERAFAGWSSSTRKLLASAVNWRAWPLYGRPSLAAFSFGRIGLVGDAAHPMLPFLAQGAAQAIEDAGALGRALSRHRSIPEQLSAYSQARVPRAARVQAEAVRQGRIYHLAGPMAFARDAAVRVLGGPSLSARYDWLYNG